MMNEQQTRDALLNGEVIADIGQFDPAAKKMLGRNVRVGRVVKFVAPWAGIRMKTHYRIATNCG